MQYPDHRRRVHSNLRY